MLRFEGLEEMDDCRYEAEALKRISQLLGDYSLKNCYVIRSK
jgi:hypothetical protein